MKRKRLKRLQYIWAAILCIAGVICIVLFTFFQEQTNNKNATYSVNAAGQIVWQQFDGDQSKTGSSNDPYITKANVTSLQKIWQVAVSSDGSPVYLSGVTTAQGVKNLAFVTTKDGGLTAFDEATGKQIWNVTTSGGAGITTSSPAIDPDNLFIYNYGKDGKVHKYNVGTGVEDTTNGWPLVATLIPNVEKGSSALAIGNGYLYVTISAYVGDAGSYVGHIVAKNLTSGATSVYNVACANTRSLLNGNCATRQSGVWARPGTVVDPNTGNVFISSGNGPYAPPNNMGDSLIELSPDLSKIVDSYTPTNFQQLQDADADLGSADVAVIPSLELGIQGGKDNKVRVLNLKNLSGQGGPNHTGGELQTLNVNCNIFSHPVSWIDGSNTAWVFVNDMCNNLYAYKVANNRLTQAYVKSGSGGSSPLMVNGVLFDQTSGAVRAIDPTTGIVLWTGPVGSMHWQSPAVVNGHVFVIDNANLTAFSVPNNSPTIGSPTGISPTFGIVGDCQTNGMCPTPTVTVTPSGTLINPSTAPTNIVTNPTPITQNPCIAGTASSSIVTVKAHHHTNGLISNLFQFLLQLLQLLFQLLGGGNSGPIQMPNPTPCPSPTPDNGGGTPSSAPTNIVPTISGTSPTPVSATPTTGAGGGTSTGGLVVNGVSVMQGNTRFIFKGVNLEYFRDSGGASISNSEVQIASQIVAKMKSLGINAVRLDYNPSFVNQGSNMTNYLAMVKLLASNSIYVMPCDHSYTGKPISGYTTTSFPDFKIIIDYAQQQGITNYLIMNPYNEPYSSDDEQSWITANEATLQYFRTTLGFKGIVVLDTASYATTDNTSTFQTLMSYDASLLGGKANIIFSNHWYPNYNYQPTLTLAKQYPLVIGEIGQTVSGPTTPSFVTQVFQGLLSTGIPNGHNGVFPWIWWWTDGNQMTDDGLTLNTFGQLIVTDYYSKVNN